MTHYLQQKYDGKHYHYRTLKILPHQETTTCDLEVNAHGLFLSKNEEANGTRFFEVSGKWIIDDDVTLQGQPIIVDLQKAACKKYFGNILYHPKW